MTWTREEVMEWKGLGGFKKERINLIRFRDGSNLQGERCQSAWLVSMMSFLR